MEKRKCIVPSWKEMHEFAEEAARQVKESDFHPDAIIGLTRGGLVPARLFADLLHLLVQNSGCYSYIIIHLLGIVWTLTFLFWA